MIKNRLTLYLHLLTKIQGEPIKEIKISFTISIPLKQTDIHWIEEELLKKRKEVFIEVMKRVIEKIEEQAIKTYEVCSQCGLALVRNG